MPSYRNLANWLGTYNSVGGSCLRELVKDKFGPYCSFIHIPDELYLLLENTSAKNWTLIWEFMEIQSYDNIVIARLEHREGDM